MLQLLPRLSRFRCNPLRAEGIAKGVSETQRLERQLPLRGAHTVIDEDNAVGQVLLELELVQDRVARAVTSKVRALIPADDVVVYIHFAQCLHHLELKVLAIRLRRRGRWVREAARRVVAGGGGSTVSYGILKAWLSSVWGDFAREREFERMRSATPRMRELKVSLTLPRSRRCIEGEVVDARSIGYGKESGVSDRFEAVVV